MTQQDQNKNLSAQFKMFDLIHRGLIILDASGKIQAANQLAAEELGYTVGQLKKMSIFEINPRYTLLGWRKKWTRLTKGESVEIDTELITANGILYPVRSFLQMINVTGRNLCCYVIENLHETNRYRDLLALTSKMVRVGSWEYDLVNQSFLITKEINKLLRQKIEEKNLSPFQALRWASGIIEKESIKKLLKKLNEAIEAGGSFELEIRLKKDKKLLTVNAMAAASEGITAKAYGILQDISGVSQRNKEMYMSQFTVDKAIEMIFWINSDRQIEYINEAVINRTGYKKEQLIGADAHDIFPQLTDNQWKNNWVKLKKGKIFKHKTILSDARGQLSHVNVQMNHLQYNGQEYSCTFIKRSNFQENQEEFIDLIYHTLNQSSDIVLWVNADGSLLYFNNTAASRLEYTKAELENLRIEDIYDGYDIFKNWETFRERKHTHHWEHKIKKKDGSTISAQATTTYINFGKTECACITYNEVTQLRKKEQQLEEAFEKIKLLQEKLQDEKAYLRAEVAQKYNLNNIITSSEKYKTVLRQMGQVAPTEATVLILGETGTGKELLARSIHKLSDREDEVMVKVNCAALPEHLIESELFGHEKGAFTGAYKRKIGRFELADKGSIFLDEIGEMPLELQSKLLRVLQEGEFERLGGTQTIKIDVRVIAATNRKLEEMVEANQFREDLYYRLNVFPIYNIPLRERKEDIPLLVGHFVKIYCEREGRPLVKIPQRAVRDLCRYEFPGNVRELENIVERALILSKGDKLNLDPVIDRLMADQKRQPAHFPTFEEMQRMHILEALERTNWKITGKNSAAELLDMNGKTLASRIRKLGIEKD